MEAADGVADPVVAGRRPDWRLRIPDSVLIQMPLEDLRRVSDLVADTHVRWSSWRNVETDEVVAEGWYHPDADSGEAALAIAPLVEAIDRYRRGV